MKLPFSLPISEPKTPLHRLSNGRWACFAPSMGANPSMQGFCMSPNQESVLGLTWEEALREPWFNAYLNEEQWRRDRQLRAEHFDRFHKTGHDTPGEAMACYQSFLSVFEQSELQGILAGDWAK